LYQEIVRMDIVTVLFGVIRIIFGLLSLFLVPGFLITLVYFPRLKEIGIIQRLIYSVFFSMGFVIVIVIFMVVALGVDTSSRNVDLAIAVFLALMLVVWLIEVFSLNKAIRKYFSRILHSVRDRRQPAITRVVYHESQRSGMNLVDHSYLLDVGSEMDIQQVIEHAGKISDIEIVQPPHPRTRYFELVITEYKEEGLSLVDDLQIYPVLVTRKPDIKFLRFLLKRGSSRIAERLYKKDRIAEIQWIYSHDFHLFAITNPDDTLDQMVDRIIEKIDQIATSQQRGSRVSSHIETTQMLREAFDTVMEKPRPAVPLPPIKTPPRPVAAQQSLGLKERDQRKLQKEIVRDLDMFGITAESFRGSDRLITKITIPDETDIDKKILDEIEGILDDDWFYE
jgi:hypothetical protein